MSFQKKDLEMNSCRICLDSEYSNGVSFDDGESWIKMYEFCFGLIISTQDKPRMLCGLCVRKMEEFSQFKDKSIKSDKIWRTTTFANPKNSSIQVFCNTDNKTCIKEEMYDCEIDALSDEVQDDTNDCFTAIKEERDCFDNLKLGSEITKSGENNIIDPNFKLPERRSKECLRENRKYICKICKTAFTFKKNYSRHVFNNKCKYRHKAKLKKPKTKKISYVKPTDFFCGLCDEKSKNEADVKEHLKLHSSNNDLSCKLCEYTGRDFADMETHRFTHQNNPSIKCHNCDKRCQNMLALQYHYRSVHLKKSGGICSTCNKVFNNYKSWKDHETLHKTAKFICDLCGRKFLYRNLIESHLRDHGEFSGFVCDICGNKFKRMSNLKLHLQYVHDTQRVKCSHCDKTFKNQKNLNKHLQRETREKKYQCEFCSKWYSTIGDLRKHKIWHTDERPFACELCGSAYKVNTQLTIHMRSHTGDLPYKCTFANCPKAFACSNQLKVHLSVHSGLKPYKCPYCDKTFHNKSNVVMHCTKRHNVTEVPAENLKRNSHSSIR